MPNGVKIGVISPHPPIVVPAVGGKRLKDAENTKKALEAAARKLKALDKDIDTIIIITPHGAVSSSAIPIYTSPIFEGDFSYFGSPKSSYQFRGDTELAIAIVKAAEAKGMHASRCPETVLDHGILVPMHYPYSVGVRKPIIPIAIAFWPLDKLFEFGKVIQEAAASRGRKIALIASADMSHRLTHDAPSGYDPAGKEFDQKLVELVRANDVKGILGFPADLAEQAGQDALWSIAVLLGAIDGLDMKADVLSYEGPFGVGYMVALYESRL